MHRVPRPRLEVTVSGTSADIDGFSQSVDSLLDEEILVLDDESTPTLRSGNLHRVVVGVFSAGGAAGVSKIALELIRTRVAEIRVVRKQDDIDVTFKGPLRSQKELDKFLESLDLPDDNE